MWNRNKPIEDMSRAELDLQEAFELLREIKQELRETKAVVEDLYFKAQLSHSLIVVRKISENKVEDLNQILD